MTVIQLKTPSLIVTVLSLFLSGVLITSFFFDELSNGYLYGCSLLLIAVFSFEKKHFENIK